MPVRLSFDEQKIFGVHLPDKHRDRPLRPRAAVWFRAGPSFRSRFNLVLAAHKTNLTLEIEMVRVTNVAGF
jgi:hypothetical protein